jgi:hypothetical protein
MCGNPHKGDLIGGLSRLRGNSQARFLGGLGMVTSPGYPTKKYSSNREVLLFDLKEKYGICKDKCLTQK